MLGSVLILEDNPATAMALYRAVQNDPRLKPAVVCHCLTDALLWHQYGGTATAALVDLGLPDGSGLEFIHFLRDTGHCTHSLVITAFGDEKNVVTAIEAGAMGYLLKDRDPQYIADSICTVLDGGSPVSPSIARHLLKRFQQPAAEETGPPQVHLTQREIEVLRLVVKGFTYQEIAAGLDMSVNTVSSHVQNIYRKLAVRSRGEAVFEAITLGLVPVT